MNCLPNILAALALLLTLSRSHSQTVVWFDGFETNAAARWSVTGAWVIGGPRNGPSSTYAGANCANTEYYPYNNDARIYCKSYLNASNTIVVPDSSLSPTLTFWEWHNFANAVGYVEIYTASNGWQQISGNYSGNSGTWSQSSFDLSSYAGQNIQVGFHFLSGGCCGNSQGWYVDNVAVNINVTTPPEVVVPPDQTVFAGQTLVLTNYATNSFLPNDVYTFRLIAPPKNMMMTKSGVLTWPTTVTQSPSTNTIVVQATDTTTPPLINSNSFVVTLINPWLPQVTMPPAQLIYAGQTMSVAVLATNEYFPGDTFSFALLSGPTNMDTSDLTYDGVLTWVTDVTQAAGNYTNVIVVTDNSAPNYSVTNSFVVTVSVAPSPVLTPPATQTIYAGSTLDLFIAITNTAFPDAVYTFSLTNSPADAAIDPSSGELTWATVPTNKPSVSTITILVSDDHTPPLSTSGSFQVVISPTPPPSLLSPGLITNYAGQTITVNLAATNNTGLAGSSFTFSLIAPSTNVTLTAAGTVIWTNTGIRNGLLVWTNDSVAPGTNNIYVRIMDAGTALTATNHFPILFLPPQPPVFNVPASQSINVGTTFTAQITASNSLLPAAIYTFGLASGTNVTITTNGLLAWTNTAAPPGSYVINAKVSDNNIPPIRATNSFTLTLLALPSQLVLTNPAPVTSVSRKFHFTVKTFWTNSTWTIYAATNLNGGSTNWIPILTTKTGPGGTLQFTDAVSTNYLQRFYRAAFQ